MRQVVATEVEYMHGVCRGIFDLWQEVQVALWSSIKPLDAKTKKKALKKSYREMLFSSDKLRTGAELTARFGIPPALAECYLRSADFFADLRKFRDNVVHQGSSVQVIFEGENGFLISEMRVPFRGLSIWQPEEREPNDLVPLMPALSYVIWRTLEFNGRFRVVKIGGVDMRHIVFAIVMAAGVGLVGMAGASAAPANGQAIAKAADHSSYITDVRGGCGRSWHRNR
jgi:hypothetical protein